MNMRESERERNADLDECLIERTRWAPEAEVTRPRVKGREKFSISNHKHECRKLIFNSTLTCSFLE